MVFLVSCVVEAMIKSHIIGPAGHLIIEDVSCWKLLRLPDEIACWGWVIIAFTCMSYSHCEK